MDAVENEDFDIQLCYLLVLAETKTAQILTAFLNKGGWPTLARWLNGYIEQKHFVGIRQLVKTYRTLPVTTQILKKPIETGKMPGKMIRSLRKHDDEVIKGKGSKVPEPTTLDSSFSCDRITLYLRIIDSSNLIMPTSRILVTPTKSQTTIDARLIFPFFYVCRAKQRELVRIINIAEFESN